MGKKANMLMSFDGRKRVVIEDVKPNVDFGRFPVKRIIGDPVRVQAAIYSDGHDHVAAHVLYRHEDQTQWQTVRMHFIGNDIWQAEFVVNKLGLWQFRVEGWVDHFDTWADDLEKRIAAQADHLGASPDHRAPASSDSDPREIPLALLTGARLLFQSSVELVGPNSGRVKDFAAMLQELGECNAVYYDNPITKELREIVWQTPDRRFSTQTADFNVRVDREKARFSTWYEFFPRSAGKKGEHGTLQDVAARIPELTNAGFDVIYLPPIHPIGSAYRKGKNNSVFVEADDVGSPWAIGNKHGGHTSIAPELGGFPDFDLVVKTAEQYGIEIALDIAFQCSPDHPWVRSHPDWFLIRPDGSIQYAENPPKKYQDIYPLNFESNDWRNLWRELCNVFLFWIKRGVRIFRVDNPHTKALPFWEWCINKIQGTHPDVIFLAEAFTRPHRMYGLAKRGFTQSYTYFTWRNTKQEITEYLSELTSEPVCNFFRPNFWPNTPDILPVILQKGGRAAFVQRAVLAATLAASYGVYGPAFELMECRPFREGGEEYADSEKYELRLWDHDQPSSLMPILKILNEARHQHPCLQQNETLHFHGIDNPFLLCYSKQAGADLILIVVNLDTENAQSGWTDLHMQFLGLPIDGAFECKDLLNKTTYLWTGGRNYVLLGVRDIHAHVFHIPSSVSKDYGDVA